ncbi:sigma-70 family RNA polymerase sigma factor [Chitinophaga agrisoli]|uniref:Sigma-70 family RNA polymerase sigma factor n=1 Tax=Chitinophaga agrisoli TaxID=2607653 RepID=A0A5B2VMT8_9BACT|nr:sigma-70 family RNA polymerase sigma factor [Chitinophaga agrisoli]KAA2240391.1 sigma-70 family RNA polymerase sigma factor [Chitinophaga agrisoli]
MYGSLNDSALWTKVIEGDQDALAFIYNTYFTSLYRYGLKLNQDDNLVKDCIHDLFVGIWHSRERLSVTSSIRFYLLASLKRKIGRQQQGIMQRLFDDREDSLSFTRSHEEVLIGQQADQERKAKLEKVIRSMPRRQQEILYLRYYEGLDTQQTADIMALSVNSTYVLLAKAMSYLKKHSDKLVLVLGWGIIPISLSCLVQV